MGNDGIKGHGKVGPKFTKRHIDEIDDPQKRAYFSGAEIGQGIYGYPAKNPWNRIGKDVVFPGKIAIGKFQPVAPLHIAFTENTSGDDPALQFTTEQGKGPTGADTNWVFGIDQTDTELKLSSGSALGSTDRIVFGKDSSSAFKISGPTSQNLSLTAGGTDILDIHSDGTVGINNSGAESYPFHASFAPKNIHSYFFEQTSAVDGSVTFRIVHSFLAAGYVQGLWVAGNVANGSTWHRFSNGAENTTAKSKVRIEADGAAQIQLGEYDFGTSGADWAIGCRPQIDTTLQFCNDNELDTNVRFSVTTDGKTRLENTTTTAKPVLEIEQLDVSEEFIRLIGTSAADNTQSLVDAADLTTPGTIQGWLKIYVQDDAGAGDITDGVYFVPFYNTPTA